jgi:hypothetical protein
MQRAIPGLVALTIAITGCASFASRSVSGEIVATGWLENIEYRSENLPNDLIGHGEITARFTISSISRGTLPDDVITVRYFNHTYLMESEMTLRLRLRNDGTYTVCSEPGYGYQCPRN